MSAPAPSPLAIVDAEPLPRQEEVLTDAALAFLGRAAPPVHAPA